MPGQGPIGVPPTDLIDEAGSEDGAAGQPRECVPACDGFSRGPDGCGGMCVVAFNDTTPGDAVAMNCVPQCQDRLCGDDGCGGLCGRCGEGLMCQDGACVCEPEVALVCCNAGTQTCWVDGCGEVGKAFETCAEGCHDDACCVPDCRERAAAMTGAEGHAGAAQRRRPALTASAPVPPQQRWPAAKMEPPCAAMTAAVTLRESPRPARLAARTTHVVTTAAQDTNVVRTGAASAVSSASPAQRASPALMATVSGAWMTRSSSPLAAS